MRPGEDRVYATLTPTMAGREAISDRPSAKERNIMTAKIVRKPKVTETTLVLKLR